MKTKEIILFLALVAGLTASRAARAEPTASTITPKNGPQIHWLAPAPARTQPVNNRRPVEGLSPQAWTTQVGWHLGTTAFPDPTTYSSRMSLFRIGHAPWKHFTQPVTEP